MHFSRLFVLMSSLAVVGVLASDLPPVYPGSTWQRTTPEAAGFDAARLSAAMAGQKGNVIVIRDGYEVAAAGNVAHPLPTFSVSKSIVSLIFATLAQQGKLNYDLAVPGSDKPTAPLATYRHFLTMGSDFGLTPHAPGQNYAYNNAGIHHIGETMRSAFFSGKSPLQIAQQQLWDRIGRQDAPGFGGYWSGWGGGFALSARDCARLGLLVLRSGNWNGTQVIPSSYTQMLYPTQIPAGATLNRSNGPNTLFNQLHITDRLPGNYSLAWWTNVGREHSALPTKLIYASGLYGNYIVVIPEYDLVIAKTSSSDTNEPLSEVVAPILAAIGSTQSPTTPPPTDQATSGQAVITGELKQWHRVTLTFTGPSTNENATPNPFSDYRLNVTFTNGSRSLTVPGYYAADGDAADSSASSGNKWRVHFMPTYPGTWTWRASFRTGANVAVSADPNAGASTAFDGATGSFNVGSSDKSGRDFRGKGVLRHNGTRYFRFAGNGEAFLKGGAGSPENFLAYYEFDGTPAKHYYSPHAGDYRSGDPLWAGSKGRNILGALNYLASQGMNSVYFLTMNVNGDGKDVWPWTSSTVRNRFDVSKLDQWEIVFSHMDRLGIAMHVIMQERENDKLLNGGELGIERKLYYRELAARFSHHPALFWNLGEETTNTTAQLKDFANFIRSVDAYDHPIVSHTYPGQQETVYRPLLGFPNLDGPSLQIGNATGTHAETLKWLAESARSGRQWVAVVDEIGPAGTGVMPDANDPNHDSVRKQVLWGNLMAGGAGVEWYFGYSYPHHDLTAEDWRSRDRMWDQTRIALDFFKQHVPFTEMTANDGLTSASDYCLAKPGQFYLVYLPNGGTTTLNLSGVSGRFSVRWFNPRTGGGLLNGSVTTINGSSVASIGVPPSEASQDWVAVIRADGATTTDPPTEPAPTPSPTGTAVTSLTLINASTNQPVPGWESIPSTATLNLATLPTRNLNVRANTNPATVGSVRFLLNGAVSLENLAPYALKGDSSGDYTSWTPAKGNYTLTATPYSGTSATGTAGTARTVTLTVIDEQPSSAPPTTSGQSVASLTLINADTSQPVSGWESIPSSATLNLATLPTRNLSIRANTNPSTVGSVRFVLNGSVWVEDSAPYALRGDGAGRYTPWTPPKGTHTLTVTPFSGTGATGTAGTARTVVLTVIDQTTSTPPPSSTPTTGVQSVVSLTLINADTNQPVSGHNPIPHGARINRAALGVRNLNIRANTNPTLVGSVVFALDGAVHRTEGVAPYAIGGDTNGDYWNWNIPAGFHTVVATPYSGTGGSGTKGTPISISFVIE